MASGEGTSTWLLTLWHSQDVILQPREDGLAGPSLMIFTKSQPEGRVNIAENRRRCNLRNQRQSGKLFEECFI